MTALTNRLIVDGLPGRRGSTRRVPPAISHAACCVLAFAAALIGGIHLADSADWSGLARSRELLAAAHIRVAEAQRALAASAGRQDVRIAGTDDERLPRAPEWPVLMMELADLAVRSGLHVTSIDPQHAEGERLSGEDRPGAGDADVDGRRTVRVVAHGGFFSVLRMLGGLAEFPVLAVPSALRIERGLPATRVEMSVDVFPALAGATVAGGVVPIPASAHGPEDDPFGGAASSAVGDGPAPRLAGTIRDARTALALFDGGDGAFAAVAPGEALGASRVVRVDADAVMLATADGPHRLALDDGGRP
ncbi:pilus assembly protein [Burkholderia dolosa]|uniref:pilus assembly protein n=1 Tax=Burkholderia dolosa TaxID=152500 RepID=UPI0027D2E60F|nr:pilus assembly protein [Burkholderia dolosa]